VGACFVLSICFKYSGLRVTNLPTLFPLLCVLYVVLGLDMRFLG
jgi:hypothetical protein